MTATRTSLTALAAAVGVVALAAPGATAVETSTLQARSVPVLPTVSGFDAATARGTVRLAFPSTWRAKRGASALTLRKGGGSCSYTVTVKADHLLVERGTDAAALVAESAPATGPYLLDEGRRGTIAWRVTRVRDRERTRLRAVRIAPTALTAGRTAPLPAGTQVYARTTVTAIDGRSDECHTGTYRNSLGPSIGDALAVQRGRGYLQPR